MAAGSIWTTFAGLSRSLLRSAAICSSFGWLGCLLDVGHLGDALDNGWVQGVTSRPEPEPFAEALGKEDEEEGSVAVGSVLSVLNNLRTIIIPYRMLSLRART